MKKIVLFIVLFLLFSCDKPSDCIESSGAIVVKEIPVTAFSKIEVMQGIELIISQGTNHSARIVAGENFINTIEVFQEGNKLILKEKSACNWVRDYGQTKIYVTTPNLEEIYSKTERKISSNGVLSYPNLTLIAVDKNGDGRDGAGTSDFVLDLNTDQLVIVTNSLSRFYLKGITKQFTIGIYNGDSRIEAQNFVAQNIYIFHRGSNDVFVFPTQKIEGKLVSTGNLYLKNTPPINTLSALYQGQIFYN